MACSPVGPQSGQSFWGDPNHPPTFAESLRFMSILHDQPENPCIGVCSTLFDDICRGCGRTATEVSNWVFLSEAERAQIWRRIRAEGTALRFTQRKGS